MTMAITAWALRTPLGSTVDEVTSRLLAGERAVQANPNFDATAYACTLAAPYPGVIHPNRSRRYVKRAGLLGMEAATEAMAQARPAPGERLGLFVGVGGLRAHWDDLMPAFEHQLPEGERSWERGLGQLHPFWMLHHLSNNAHALLSIELGARGEGLTLGGANAGAQALSAACRTLEAGAIDAALVVAYDTLLEPETLVELAEAGALTRAGLDGLAAPYDERAGGFVPGEGAGAVVLERVEPAGSRALAWIDVAEAADGQEGPPKPETMLRASEVVSRGEDVADGAGLARAAFDLRERELLGALLGSDAALVATTASLGQLGAATAVVQAVTLGTCLRRGRLPPIAGLARPAPGPLVPVQRTTTTNMKSALALSAGAPGLAGAVRVEVP